MTVTLTEVVQGGVGIRGPIAIPGLELEAILNQTAVPGDFTAAIQAAASPTAANPFATVDELPTIPAAPSLAEVLAVGKDPGNSAFDPSMKAADDGDSGGASMQLTPGVGSDGGVASLSGGFNADTNANGGGAGGFGSSGSDGGGAFARAGTAGAGGTGGQADLWGGDGNAGGTEGARITAKGGTATDPGGIFVRGIPTSDPLVAGQIYSLAGVLKVSAG